MKFLKIIIPAFLLVAIAPVSGQQFPMYSQYIMNGFLLNPSYAGSDGYTTFGVTARQQWMGMDGAPGTYAVTGQTRLLKNSYISRATTVRKKISRPTKGGRVGVGGYIFADRNGIMKRTGFQAAYAYHINMRNYKQLSFGLSLSAYQYNVDLNGAVLPPTDDPLLDGYDQVVYIPDANFGVSYSTRTYYVGYSMTNLFRGLIMVGNNSGDTTKNGNSQLGYYFLTGGYRFELTDQEIIIEPSVMFKSSDMFLKAFQMDITTRVYYKEDYWLGLSYRTNDAIIALAGFKVDRYHFGVAYDVPLTDIRTQSFGSIEISILAKFGDSARRYRWINRY